MRILAIGDIHGKNIWEQAVESIAADIVIFVGDYVISKRFLFMKDLRSNLEALIAFKRNNFHRVHLLLGNHDTPYFYSPSGFRRMFSSQLCALYQKNSECFSVAFERDNLLFTHAGVSKPWYARHRQVLDAQRGETFADKLNAIHQSPQFEILHEKGRARGGQFDHGGITYADKTETEMHGIDGVTQVVGHTKVPQPVISNFGSGKIVYIDCLNSVNEFLYIDNGKMSFVTLQGNHSALKS
jgi:predicted phosphodiesterase